MSAASIYAKKKTTTDLNDSNYADQIKSFRNSHGNETMSLQQQQMAQQQEQYQKIRLPQEKLMQSGPTMAPQGRPKNNQFSAFRSVSHAAAASSSADSTKQQQIHAQAVQKQRAEQQQLQQKQRLANENRFELFYSRSCPQSRQQAEHVLEALETYFPVEFIRQHMVAIDFDNEKLVGPVHEAILRNQEYLSLIRVNCLLYDKFENSLILPSQKVNLQVILKNYCRSMAPKQQQESVGDNHAPSNSRLPQKPQQPQQQQAIVTAPRAVQQTRAPTYDSDGNLVAAPSSMISGVSALAKHVGADINSPSAAVNLKTAVPTKSNALILADTQDEVNALAQSNVASMYSKNRGVTLGFGEDLSAITREFVERHNAGNPLDREITSSTGSKNKGSKKNTQVNPVVGRKQDFQPQHLQGLPDAPFVNNDDSQPSVPQKQRRLPMPASAPTSSQPLNEHEQLGVIKQIKCTK